MMQHSRKVSDVLVLWDRNPRLPQRSATVSDFPEQRLYTLQLSPTELDDAKASIEEETHIVEELDKGVHRVQD